MDWLRGPLRAATAERDLQIMYTIDGATTTPEETLDHLEGYRGSRPVRIGNGAAGQLQLDVYGEIMDSVYLYNKYGEPDLLRPVGAPCASRLDWLEQHWTEADEGIWEVRGPRQRFTYSALMTWVAFDRARRLAQRPRAARAPRALAQAWPPSAYRFVQAVRLEPRARAYVQYPGSQTLDAGSAGHAAGQVRRPDATRGSCPPSSGSSEELVTDSLVHRYRNDGSDGFTEAEGTFNLCSFWYVEALTRAGRVWTRRGTSSRRC